MQRQIPHVAQHPPAHYKWSWKRNGGGMGLTQTIPIFTSLGPSTPDPWIHREIHKTFYTEDYFCFPTFPGQALWGLPRRQEMNSHGLPSLFSRSPLWSSRPPSHPRTKPLGDLGLGSGEEGGGGGWKETVMDSISEASSAGPRAAALPHLNSCPLEKFQAETQNTATILYK